LKLLYYIPSPGIGDAIVRHNAINLLARHTKLAVATYLPKCLLDVFTITIDARLSIIPLSSTYHNNAVLGLLSKFKLPRPLLEKFDAVIVAIDHLSFFGIIKQLVICKLLFRSKKIIFNCQIPFSRLLGVSTLTDNPSIHKKEYFLNCAGMLIRELSTNLDYPEYEISQTSPAKLLPYIVVAPSAKYPYQIWPHYKKLLAMLQYKNVRVVLLGALNEETYLKSIRSSESQHVLVGRPISEVYKIIQKSGLVITNDSGLLHLSVFSKTFAIALCGCYFTKPWTGYPPSQVMQIFADSHLAAMPNTKANRITALKSIRPETIVDALDSLA